MESIQNKCRKAECGAKCVLAEAVGGQGRPCGSFVPNTAPEFLDLFLLKTTDPLPNHE